MKAANKVQSELISFFFDGIDYMAKDDRLSKDVLNPWIKEDLLDKNNCYWDDEDARKSHDFTIRLPDNKLIIKRSFYTSDPNLYYVDFNNKICRILDTRDVLFELAGILDNLLWEEEEEIGTFRYSGLTRRLFEGRDYSKLLLEWQKDRARNPQNYVSAEDPGSRFLLVKDINGNTIQYVQMANEATKKCLVLNPSKSFFDYEEKEYHEIVSDKDSLEALFSQTD